MTVMRYPDGHKEEVRTRIVKATSEALRTHGIEAVSIPKLMKQVGLTHGGFYAHFRDRDELVAEAIGQAAKDSARQVYADDRDLDAVLDTYLSRGHLEHPMRGCVLAALGTDGARQKAPVRRAFAEAARGMLTILEKKLHPKRPKREVSDDTLARASMMIGAIVLGRLVNDAALADRILSAARKLPAA